MSDYTTTTYTTDVLVIGGGMAAVFAAHRALNNGAKVMMIDKGSVGRSGQTPFASAMGVFDEDAGDDRETWHKNMAENAKNLNNPAYLDNFMDYSKGIYEELTAWQATDIGFGNVLRNKIMEMDIELLERTMITNLLEEDGRVLGAAGFKLDQEEAVIVHAKAVILCTGAGGFKPNGFQVCSLTFDGDAMAYRIGAKISGKEFVDTHGTLAAYPAYCWGQWQGMWNMGLPKLTNPLIEGGGQALDLSQYHSIHDGTEMEMPGGGAPSEGEEGERPSGPPSGEGEMPAGGEMPADGEMPAEGEMAQGGRGGGQRPSGEEGGEMPAGGPPSDGEGGTDLRSGGSIGGASAGLSVHKAEGIFPINNKCASNIEGLYAAGDSLSSMLVGPIYNGVCGFSVAGSATQGALAGETAADYIKGVSQKTVSDSKAASVVEGIFEPLTNEQGYSPDWVEHMIQGALIPYYVLYIKHEDRLNAALTNIEFYRDHFSEKLRATDLHGLRKAHEVKNMLLNAEMKLKSSLFRTESRGNHYREDYPDTDEENWQAWVVMEKDTDGSMKLEKFYRKDFVSI